MEALPANPQAAGLSLKRHGRRAAALLCCLLALCLFPAGAQEKGAELRFVDVTGTSELTVAPDEIHFLVSIQEYWEEEFEEGRKPEDYRTKVPLARIEEDLRRRLGQLGISAADIRAQEVGNYWREPGRDFLVGKELDITLRRADEIGRIVQTIDTRGVKSMRVGSLLRKDMPELVRRGKIAALEAAREKAAYLAATLGKKLGGVLRIVEPQEGSRGYAPYAQSNVQYSQDALSEGFRNIRLHFSMNVRYELVD